MKILIGCNKSGREAMAFNSLGHDAWTCDLLPAEYDGNHIQDDVLNHLYGWDMAIFNPDCTFLANSGVRWLHERPERLFNVFEAAEFFNKLLNAPISLIAVENPIQHKYARQLIRKPDQIIQPWWFGDGLTKATCLWLKGLPPLMASLIRTDRYAAIHLEPPREHRKENRSRTPQGLAQAMADQWGK